MPQIVTIQSTTDNRRAVWRPADRGNYTNANRGAKPIDRIVIHVAEGSYSAAIKWFQHPRSNACAHYVLDRKGHEAQCVKNEDIAWHAGWWKTNK